MIFFPAHTHLQFCFFYYVVLIVFVVAFVILVGAPVLLALAKSLQTQLNRNRVIISNASPKLPQQQSTTITTVVAAKANFTKIALNRICAVSGSSVVGRRPLSVRTISMVNCSARCARAEKLFSANLLWYWDFVLTAAVTERQGQQQ